MRRSGLIATLVLLLVINSIVLAGVYYNRSGTPDATILLNERELPLAYNYRHDENSGVSLKLNWNRQEWQWPWFDADKLAELGFDRNFVDYVEKRKQYYRHLPIKAFVVLEFNGQSWQDYLEKQQEKIEELPLKVAEGSMQEDAAVRQEKQLRASMRLGSRLFAIDAGLNPESLRVNYPDRQKYLILPAEVRAVINWETQADSKERVRKISGRIDKILTDTIYVASEYHALLEEVPNKERIYPGNYYYNPDANKRVHYEVQLNVGKRYEPWLGDIIEVD